MSFLAGRAEAAGSRARDCLAPASVSPGPWRPQQRLLQGTGSWPSSCLFLSSDVGVLEEVTPQDLQVSDSGGLGGQNLTRYFPGMLGTWHVCPAAAPGKPEPVRGCMGTRLGVLRHRTPRLLPKPPGLQNAARTAPRASPVAPVSPGRWAAGPAEREAQQKWGSGALCWPHV